MTANEEKEMRNKGLETSSLALYQSFQIKMCCYVCTSYKLS